jgi:hypothetical protein
VARLRFVLAEQRDHYLPLRVIKDHLDAIDRGLEPPERGRAATRRGPRAVSAVPMPGAEAFVPESSEVRMSREELLGEAGLEAEQLEQLEQFGLLSKRAGGAYDGDALAVATAPPRWPGTGSSHGTCVPSGPRPTARSGCSSRWSRR